MLRACTLCAFAALGLNATAQGPAPAPLLEVPGHAFITVGRADGAVVHDVDLTRPIDLRLRLATTGDATALVAELSRLQSAAPEAARAMFAAPQRLPDGSVRARLPRGVLGAVASLPYVEDLVFEQPFAGPLGETADERGASAAGAGSTVTVRITTDRPLPYVLFAGLDGMTYVEEYTAVSPTTLDLQVPPGTYDLLVYHATGVAPFTAEDAAAVFLEQLVISGPQTIDVPSTAAIHAVSLDGVDESGQLLTARDPDPSPSASLARYLSRHRFTYPDGSAILFVDSPLMNDDAFVVSPLSTRFRVFASELALDFLTENDVYSIQHPPLVGVSGGAQLANVPADLTDAEARIRAPREAVLIVSSVAHVRLVGRTVTTSIGFILPAEQRAAWDVGLHLTPDVDPALALTTSLQAGFVGGLSLSWVATPPYRAFDGRIMSVQDRTPTPATYGAPDGGVLPLGEGPVWPDLFGDGVGGSVQVAAFIRFDGMLDEERRNDYTTLAWRLDDEAGATVAQGTDFFVDYVPPTPGPFTFVATQANTLVQNVRGTGVLTATFDGRLADSQAPKITSLQLRDADGDVVPGLVAGEPATLAFSAGDFIISSGGLETIPLDDAATAVYVRPFDTETWTLLQHELVGTDHGTSMGLGHEPLGSLYRADLTGLAAAGPGGYDLRIDVADPAGNTFSWVLEPAFTVGDFTFPTPAEGPPPAAVVRLSVTPNPSRGPITATYDLPAAGPVTLTVLDVLGREVARVVDATRAAGPHTVRIDAVLPAGLYIVRLTHASGVSARVVTVID